MNLQAQRYDIASAIAKDVSGGGRGVLIGVITHYDARAVLADDEPYHAYLDESINGSGEMVCSAGYLFVPAMAQQFRESWKPYLDSKGLECFHANDCFRRKDAEELFTELASLTKRTAMRGFVQFRNPKDMLSLHKSIRHYVGSCYCHVTLTCMKMMAELAREQNKLIVYFIEDGNEYAGELRHFLNQIKENPTLVEIYAMAGADTYKKQDVIQLQAADLHAWSFGRSHYRRRWEKGLVELVKDGTLRHTMGKYDPMMFSLFNSFYGLRSNRKTFDYEKQKHIRGTDEGSPQRKKNVI